MRYFVLTCILSSIFISSASSTPVNPTHRPVLSSSQYPLILNSEILPPALSSYWISVLPEGVKEWTLLAEFEERATCADFDFKVSDSSVTACRASFYVKYNANGLYNDSIEDSKSRWLANVQVEARAVRVNPLYNINCSATVTEQPPATTQGITEARVMASIQCQCGDHGAGLPVQIPSQQWHKMITATDPEYTKCIAPAYTDWSTSLKASVMIFVGAVLVCAVVIMCCHKYCCRARSAAVRSEPNAAHADNIYTYSTVSPSYYISLPQEDALYAAGHQPQAVNSDYEQFLYPYRTQEGHNRQ